MVEETHAGEGHNHAVLVAFFNNEVVTDGTAGFSNVLDTGSERTLDVVCEGEECIGSKSEIVEAVEPFALFFSSERSGLFGEVVLPDTVCTNIFFVAVDVAVDYIVSFGSAHSGKERKCEGLGMLAEKPCISLGACESGAVDSGLLTCAYADRLTVDCIANGVGLGVLEGDQSNDKVALCGCGKLLVIGYDVFKKVFADLEFVSALFEGDAVNILGFDGFGLVFGIDFNDVVSALSLALEDFESFGFVSGSDDTVGNFTSDELCGGYVTYIGESNPVTEGAETVGTACTNISTGERGLVKTFDIFNEASLLERFGEGKTNSSRSGRNVLEGSYSGKTESFLEFLNELIGVESVEEVDVAGTTVENGDGKIASVLHEDSGRLLIGVTTVLEFKFFHFIYVPFVFSPVYDICV